MGLNVGTTLKELRDMTVPELRRKYAEVFGDETRLRHREFLIRKIIWRMQAIAEGDFVERAKRLREKAARLARDADVRITPPPLRSASDAPAGSNASTTLRLVPPPDGRLPMPGAELSRVYRGRTITVRVLEDGFEYDGEVYRSLSAVAKAVTGSHWNGYHFFGLEKPSKEHHGVRRP